MSDVCEYHVTDVALWSDAKFLALSRPAEPNAQTIFQFLLTGPYRTRIPGIVICKPALVAIHYEWEPFAKPFRESFGELFRAGLIKVDERVGLIWLPGALKPNRKGVRPQNPNVVKGWGRVWPKVPECSLKHEAWRALKSFTEQLGESFLKSFLESLPEPFRVCSGEQEQEQEQDLNIPPTPQTGGGGGGKRKRGKGKSPPAAAIEVAEKAIAYFNQKFDRHYKPSTYGEHIEKLLARGHTWPEIKGVIWWAGETWSDEYRAKTTPLTLLKTVSPQGHGTFKTYLGNARDFWMREAAPGELPPWERQTVTPPAQPELPVAPATNGVHAP